MLERITCFLNAIIPRPAFIEVNQPNCLSSSDLKSIKSIKKKGFIVFTIEPIYLKDISREEVESKLYDAAMEIISHMRGEVCPECHSDEIGEYVEVNKSNDRFFCNDCGHHW